MAVRPAWRYHGGIVEICDFEFQWNGGFAVSQKRKNIAALHGAIMRRFGENALEISTKSLSELGQRLSAFNLTLGGVILECVFQSGKVFENGGPYTDLLERSPKEAKRDERLKTSGKLTAFEYEGKRWGLEPRSAFYDHLYIKSVLEAFTEEEPEALGGYVWFTDIEFNPGKSINSQARAAALLKAVRADGAKELLGDPEKWTKYHESKTRFSYSM